MNKYQLKKQFHAIMPVDQDISHLLSRYVQAWEAADSARLIALLREDAIFTIPPFPVWFQGRAAIKAFLDTYLFIESSERRFRLVATAANSAPAFLVYEADTSGVYQPNALQILRIVSDQVVQIDDFLTLLAHLVARFNLTPF